MWEVNESKNLEMTIKSLSHGFRIGPDNEIVCADYGVKARIIGIASGTKLGHSSTSGWHLWRLLQFWNDRDVLPQVLMICL
jgi:hypothetical protein